MNKPKCFIELCAGTAALSVRLQGGKDAKPPVSRMGAKTGYADVILSVLGLYPGLGAESFVWCEPDDGVRGLLMAYCQPSVLKEAAKILRSWKDEEPRALWERLRAELKAGASVEGAEGVVRVCMVLGCSMSGTEDRYSGWFNPQGEAACAWHGEAKISQLVAAHGRDDKGRPLAKSSAHPDNLAPRLDDMAERAYPPTFIARDGRAVTPEEVARLILTGVWSYKQMMPESGFVGPGARRQDTRAVAVAVDEMALEQWPPVTITDDARMMPPNKLPEGVIVYCDPPYLNTTGYKHDLHREEVVRLARLWSDAGATVCISEQTTIPELIADGWHGVQISFARKGQKRTFSDQQDEYLTINRKPHFIPREPEPMFDDLKVVKKPKVKVVRVSQATETQPINQQVQTLDLFGNTNND